MLTIVQGNLLNSNCSVIAHQANCQGVMGSGIALQIKKKFPLAYKSFIDDKRDPKVKLGSYSFALCNPPGVIVFNLYGQLHFGRFDCVYTDYVALRQAVIKMITKVDEIEISCDMKLTIGMPYGIGCGLANGDWNVVQRMLEDVSILYNREIFLYKL